MMKMLIEVEAVRWQMCHDRLPFAVASLSGLMFERIANPTAQVPSGCVWHLTTFVNGFH